MNSLLYNDELNEATAFALPLPNRGLAFGDGFFETLIFATGRLRLAAVTRSAHRIRRAPADFGTMCVFMV